MAEGARYLEAPKGLVSLLSLNLANKIVSDAFYTRLPPGKHTLSTNLTRVRHECWRRQIGRPHRLGHRAVNRILHACHDRHGIAFLYRRLDGALPIVVGLVK